MQQPSRQSLWKRAAPGEAAPGRFIADAGTRVAIQDLGRRSGLDTAPETLRGSSVLIATEGQLAAALAVLALDGVARRLVLCPPDLSPAHLSAAMEDAEVDAVVSDGGGPAAGLPHGARVVRCTGRLLDSEQDGGPGAERSAETEWVLFTSGTTGRPKLAVHSLDGLVGPSGGGRGAAGSGAVWSTFYDVRRYGGLQILLRALAGHCSMVLSSAGESTAAFLSRAGEAGVTHISGTPSHWRRVLISAAADRIAPGYVRLSGEICDQAILDRLRETYPHATIVHAFASTEAGVAFEVRDGLSGFPASLLTDASGPAEMRVEDGSLRIRSTRNAQRYLGAGAPALQGGDGFVDTGDLVELRPAADGDRYHFIGRRGGIINVGGLKVHPEAVEAVINQHPAVQVSRVSARRSPITGAIVVGEVVVSAAQAGRATPFEEMSGEIMALCRAHLPPHQVPAMLRQVPSIEVAASGKLVRPHS
jgi:acyl-coenzyme A synthetase/AMP-(fatty) acid ligase